MGKSVREMTLITPPPSPLNGPNSTTTAIVDKTIKVGLWLKDSKYTKLIQFFDTDHRKENEKPRPPFLLQRVYDIKGAFECDVILHKVFDEDVHIKEADLVHLSTHNCLLDPLDCILVLSDRFETVKKINRFFLEHSADSKIKVPFTIRLLRTEGELDGIAEHSLFPAIAKPISACSDSFSHTLYLVNSASQVNFLPSTTSFIMQKFIKHGQFLIKAYIIGDSLDLVFKNSLSIKSFSTDRLYGFDSQSLKALQNPMVSNLVELQSSLYPICMQLRNFLGLSLLGLDFIVEEETGSIFLIDANYFPGFSGVDRIDEKIFKLLLNKLGHT